MRLPAKRPGLILTMRWERVANRGISYYRYKLAYSNVENFHKDWDSDNGYIAY